MIPPPRPLTMASVTTPTMSRRAARTAVSPPLTAKVKGPARSRETSSAGSVVIIQLPRRRRGSPRAPRRRRSSCAGVRGEEGTGPGQRGLALVEDSGECLEHVRHAGCHLQGDRDVVGGGPGGEPDRVVE